MRQTPVGDYLEEVSTRLSEELYGNLSDAIYETICEFDEEVAQLKTENAKLREQVDAAHMSRLLTENENEKLRELLHRLLVEYRYLRVRPRKMYLQHEGRMRAIEEEMRELGVEVDA